MGRGDRGGEKERWDHHPFLTISLSYPFLLRGGGGGPKLTTQTSELRDGPEGFNVGVQRGMKVTENRQDR